MNALNVVRLPGASDQPVQQIRRRGRYPKTIARLVDAKDRRWRRGWQQTMIDGRTNELKRWIREFEAGIIAAYMEIDQLKGIEAGSDLAGDVCWYLEWNTWSPEAKERWAQGGGKIPARPY